MINNEPFNKQKTFSLVKKTTFYNDDVLTSIYFKNNFLPVKKCGPIILGGYKLKLDFESGAIKPYAREDCDSCLGASIRRTKILLTGLLESNTFDYFLTLTFNGSKVERENPAVVFEKYRKYVKFLKQKFPSLAYVTVHEEHHDENGCIHFHILLKLNGVSLKDLQFVKTNKVCCHWATIKNNLCSREYFEKTKHDYTLKETDGLPVYNVNSFIYGFTTATRIANTKACNEYVKKYLDKAFAYLDVFGKRFFYTKNLNLPNSYDELLGADFISQFSLETNKNFKYENVYDIDKVDEKVYKKYNKKYNVFQARMSKETFNIYKNSNLGPDMSFYKQYCPWGEEQLTIDNIKKPPVND
ncbi:MAG: hypothetical protein RR247_01990 [Clostridia bacterium]